MWSARKVGLLRNNYTKMLPSTPRGKSGADVPDREHVSERQNNRATPVLAYETLHVK